MSLSINHAPNQFDIIGQLPNEISLSICRHCDPLTLLGFGSVSRAFRQLGQDNMFQKIVAEKLGFSRQNLDNGTSDERKAWLDQKIGEFKIILQQNLNHCPHLSNLKFFEALIISNQFEGEFAKRIASVKAGPSSLLDWGYLNHSKNLWFLIRVQMHEIPVQNKDFKINLISLPLRYKQKEIERPFERPFGWKNSHVSFRSDKPIFPERTTPTISFTASKVDKIAGYIPIIGTFIGLWHIYEGIKEHRYFTREINNQELKNHAILWMVRGAVECLPLIGGLACAISDLAVTTFRPNEPIRFN